MLLQVHVFWENLLFNLLEYFPELFMVGAILATLGVEKYPCGIDRQLG